MNHIIWFILYARNWSKSNPTIEYQCSTDSQWSKVKQMTKFYSLEKVKMHFTACYCFISLFSANQKRVETESQIKKIKEDLANVEQEKNDENEIRSEKIESLKEDIKQVFSSSRVVFLSFCRTFNWLIFSDWDAMSTKLFKYPRCSWATKNSILCRFTKSSK